jgi:hypothetical protein
MSHLKNKRTAWRNTKCFPFLRSPEVGHIHAIQDSPCRSGREFLTKILKYVEKFQNQSPRMKNVISGNIIVLFDQNEVHFFENYFAVNVYLVS